MTDTCCELQGCDGFTFEKAIRHAQQFGSLEDVYLTAEEHRWEAADLSRLAISLRQIDKSWSLSREAKLRLVDRMLTVGMDPGRICMAVGLSRRSLESLIRASESAQEAATAPPKCKKPKANGSVAAARRIAGRRQIAARRKTGTTGNPAF